jgi:Secretion system C-terminal sorting domain
MKNLLLFFLFYLISSTGFGQNLIVEGGFEGLPAGILTNSFDIGIWGSSTTANNSVTVNNNMANARTGDKFLNMQADFRNLRQKFTCVANTQYKLSVWYRNVVAGVLTTDAPYFSIRLSDGANNGNGTILQNAGVNVSGQVAPFHDADAKIYNNFTLTFNSGSNTELIFYCFNPARVPNTNTNNAVRIDDVSITVEGTSSTNELSQINFNFYPNPVKDQLFFSADKNIDKVELFNVNGQKVLQKELNNSKSSQLNMGDLTDGIYFLKAYANGGFDTYQVVKQ